MELGEKKVAYEGSLDRLYNHDFYKFLEYNIQDVMLIANMDKKLQFIDLANTIAHDNTVLLFTTMGAVATTEQAIINEAHRRGMCVPDRKRSKPDPTSTAAAGAYVATPKKGFHDWIGSMDINSLYPSVFRALNMAQETIVGQLRQDFTEEELTNKIKLEKMSFADAWLGKFGTNEYEMVMDKDVNHVMKLDMEDGSSLDVTGADVYNLIFNSGQPWCISSNGTIFKTDVAGVIPGLLERWYVERQELQAKKKAATDAEEIAFSSYILPTINLVDSEEAPGLVLTQDIENGEELPEGTEVTLEVSGNKFSAAIPNISPCTLTADEGKNLIRDFMRENNVILFIKEEFEENELENCDGKIIGTNVPQGAVMTTGDTLIIVISNFKDDS